MKVSDLMTREVASVPETATLGDAARVMWERDCGIVPILGGDSTLRGVITDRDVCMGAYSQGRALNEIPVTRSMCRDPFTCRADSDLGSVAKTMQQHQIRRLPVVDAEGRLEGILSLTDLARQCDGSSSRANPKFKSEVAETLGHICRPIIHMPAKSSELEAGS